MTILQYISVACGFISALAWLGSALVKVPTVYANLGSFHVPPQPGPQKLDPVVTALRRQSKFSSAGAVFAAVSIIAQTASTLT